MVRRSHTFPLRVLPLIRFPALSLLPGHNAAQLATWAELGNCSMLTPNSATMLQAVVNPTPGNSIHNRIASSRGDGGNGPSAGSDSRMRAISSAVGFIRSAISSSNWRIWFSRDSICRQCRSIRCFCQLDLAPFDALIWPHLVLFPSARADVSFDPLTYELTCPIFPEYHPLMF